mgnify:CR=1 FL=1
MYIAKRSIRFAARVWGGLVFLVAVLMIVMPDPEATEPIPVEDWFLLSLWGVAVLGLVIAWRWPVVGAILTLATMFVRELAWIVLKGGWLVSFLLFWLWVVPPAILHLVAWGLDRRMVRSSAVQG